MAGGCEHAPSTQAKIVNALTIDVEEHFHPNAMDEAVAPDQWDALPHRVEANTHHVLDLLSEHGVKATFFVLGWVAERWPRLVADIARQGHEVACHGFAHRLAYKLGPAGFRTDVVRVRLCTVSERRVGPSLPAPFGQWTF
jgi:peptidoglycan/xylan/chitin deacetylase (PgdA/CDA1 family)